MLCDDLEWWVGGGTQKEGDICVHIADPFCWTAETNTALSSNYTPTVIIKRSVRVALNMSFAQLIWPTSYYTNMCLNKGKLIITGLLRGFTLLMGILNFKRKL